MKYSYQDVPKTEAQISGNPQKGLINQFQLAPVNIPSSVIQLWELDVTG